MRLFVDTSAWFALHDRSDQHHPDAVEFLNRFRTETVLLFTNNYVVDETLTLIRLRTSHTHAVHFLDSLQSSPAVSSMHVFPETIKRAEAIFRSHPDKRWSFTDCVSFAFMDEIDLENAFAFDSHFAQYGKIVHPARSGTE